MMQARMMTDLVNYNQVDPYGEDEGEDEDDDEMSESNGDDGENRTDP